MTAIALFHDYSDAAEYINNTLLKGRKITRLVAASTARQYAQQMEKLYFTERVSEFVFPTIWETALSKFPTTIRKELPDLVAHLPIKITAPLEGVPLEEIISKFKSRRNYAGACEHWQKDEPEENCGMCLPCLHKYLVLKKLGRKTDEIFLEDPIDGYNGRFRLYKLLSTISDPRHVMTRMEVTVAQLIADCFMKDLFPEDLCDIMEKRFKNYLKAWGGEL